MIEKVALNALVTGAHTGIGLAISRELAACGYNIFMVARNAQALEQAAASVTEQYGVQAHWLAADLTEIDSPQRVFDWVAGKQQTIDFLVNNAGVGWNGRFVDGTTETFDAMLALNVRSVVELTRLFTPHLLTSANGRILNVASMAGLYPVPFKAVYASSKAFVQHFTRCLADELAHTNVKASVLCAGPVPTTDELRQEIESGGWSSRLFAVETAVVGRIAVRKTLAGKRIILPGAGIKLGLFMLRAAPDWLRSRVFLKQFSRYLQ